MGKRRKITIPRVLFHHLTADDRRQIEEIDDTCFWEMCNPSTGERWLRFKKVYCNSPAEHLEIYCES